MNIRPATPDDAHAVAGIKTESWRHAYRGIVPDAVREAMTVEDVRKRWLAVAESDFAKSVVVIGDAGQLGGYAMFGPIRGVSHSYGGQLYEIYLRPSCMGKGIGTVLFSAASQRLHSIGYDSFLLWVFATNTSARRFYERLGGTLLEGASLTTTVGGAHLPEVAYGFRPLPVPVAKR